MNTAPTSPQTKPAFQKLRPAEMLDAIEADIQTDEAFVTSGDMTKDPTARAREVSEKIHIAVLNIETPDAGRLDQLYGRWVRASIALTIKWAETAIQKLMAHADNGKGSLATDATDGIRARWRPGYPKTEDTMAEHLLDEAHAAFSKAQLRFQSTNDQRQEELKPRMEKMREKLGRIMPKSSPIDVSDENAAAPIEAIPVTSEV